MRRLDLPESERPLCRIAANEATAPDASRTGAAESGGHRCIAAGFGLYATSKGRRAERRREKAMVGENEVLDALAGIVGPDGRSAVSRSNGIVGLTIRNDKVYLALSGNPRLVQAMETMRTEAEAAIKALPGVAAAIVSLTAERGPGTAGGLPGQGQAAQGQAGQSRADNGRAGHSHGQAPGMQPRPAAPRNLAIPGIERIVAVASGKGGVGKSTTAVNLALALAATGWRIGILDADIYGPSLPRLLGLDAKPEREGKMLKPLHAFGIKAMSVGFLVPEREAMIWRGPMVSSAINMLLREVEWGELDCLIVDMPPGTGDAQLSLAQGVPMTGAVIVSTPQDLALIDARRGVAMFEKTGVPVLGLIENMSTFICPHCGGRSDIFAHGGARREADHLGVPFLGEVPLTMAIREQADAGRPTAAVAAASEPGQVYRAIAEKVRAALEAGRRRAAPRISFE